MSAISFFHHIFSGELTGTVMFKQGAFVNLLTADSRQWSKQLKQIEKLPSLDHIELWMEHIPKNREINEIKDLFRGIELIIHGPFIHASLVSHLPEVVKLTERRFDETVEFASAIAARVITFHAGSYPLFLEKHEVLERLAHRFERFSGITDPVMTLENMPVKSYGTMREPIGILADCESMLKLLPNLRFTLDIGHCIQNEDDFVPFIQKHVSRIENIHLHDGIPRGKAHMGIGNGSLNLERFLEALVAVNFEKHVGIETISFEDTSSSWDALCKAEHLKGIRDCDCYPRSPALSARWLTHR
jgi:sugar phosphate isomerase/epimerase